MTERTHGGKREGAGRPPTFSKEAKRLSIRIEPEHAAMLREAFGSVSEGIRAMIEELGKRPTKPRQGQKRIAP